MACSTRERGKLLELNKDKSAVPVSVKAMFGWTIRDLSCPGRPYCEPAGRVRDNEAHLPWKIVAPPDALDAHRYDVVEWLGQVGSVTIVAGLGKNAPPLRTVQRRLQKLVSDGMLATRGARKNVVCTLAGRDGSG